MKVSNCERFLEMQENCLNELMFLIEYDKKQEKEQGIASENSIPLKGFIDTQNRALAIAKKLLEKHKESLTAIEKEEAEKKKKEQAEKAKAEKKAKDKAKQVEETKKALKQEDSLFAEVVEDTNEEANADDYAFEENDTDGEEE